MDGLPVERGHDALGRKVLEFVVNVEIERHNQPGGIIGIESCSQGMGRGIHGD